MDVFDLAAKITLDANEYERGMDSAKKENSNFVKSVVSVSSTSDTLTNALKSAGDVSETLKNKISVLAAQYNDAEDEVKKLTNAFNKSADVNGTASEETRKLAEKLAEAEKKSAGLKGELDKLTETTAEAGEKAQETGGKFSSFAKKLKDGLANAAKIGAAALAAVTAATTAMSAAMIKGVSDTAAYGDNIDKMSQKMGMSAQAYQEWDAIMQHSGTSIESLQSSMKTLANAVENGNGAFERLGITQEQIASMNNEELFSATITALQNVENETERTYLAGQLLGRGATELGALLNTSAEDTEAMRKRVHELGGVMSDEAVKASAAFQDSLQDLQTGISGMSRGMLADFLPAITQVMDGLTMLLTGGESGLDQISQGIDSFVGNLTQVVPRMFEVGGRIMGSLVQAITSNLPSLISSGTQIIIEFVSGALEMLPEVTSAAPEIITTLSNGIAEAIPELIPAAVEAILQIVETLSDPDSLTGLIDAALAIILALADGLLEVTPKLLESVPKIVQNLVTAFVQNAPKLLAAGGELLIGLGIGIVEAIPELLSYVVEIPVAIISGIKDGLSGLAEIGPDIIRGLWEGIKNMGAWINDKVSGFFSGIVDGVKGRLGIHSPSRVFAGIGENMALGLGDGWDDEFSRIKKNIESGMDFGTEKMGFSIASVDFASSAVGQSSAAIVNSVTGGENRNVPVIPLTINLLTGDARPFAQWILNDLIQVAAANGTPIAGQQYA